MPQLVNGVWVKGDIAASEIRNGAFHREPTRFRGWITPNGEADPQGEPARPAEAGRYHLYVSYLCPWASRALIFRTLKGLEGVVGLSVAGPILGEDGWVYPSDEDAGPVLPRFRHHHELYTASDPAYTGKVSVPVLWDRREGRIVNNESADIIRILNSAFDGLTGNRLDLYPAFLRADIDRWNGLIYETVNNGVYRCGFAKSQESYDAAFDALFGTLDRLEAHLSSSRYLAGEWLTEADWRLFVTLVRFDPAYHGAFKCNLRRIADYPNLSNYLRELYQWPGIAATVSVEAIKAGYYTNPAINPTLIVPKGPALDLDASHDRDRLRGQGIPTRG
ncbi:glutathione S-transferase family protein [Azospirillum doebereinerae]|uniref:Glutathione S-transferase family protein n=1 Tax=Azospirillum doebereinerae TaxID=92933 RepID=A0A433J5M4_9PROT|nr:glutathione S-transferase family protein [Azospirillum doebereinerae]MCG5239381.1 glutathione S-transferase family protein [Azospirillum doebereinerae]RUQ67876.1 glutathione S-transferase family protein [Azospirillum doebereinerae]